MAATEAGPRTTRAHLGPSDGNQSSGSTSGQTSTGHQEQGLPAIIQDLWPVSHPQHYGAARPIFCIPAPPLPPFFQYQWSMPLSYNPFSGFPGIGESSGFYFFRLCWFQVVHNYVHVYHTRTIHSYIVIVCSIKCSLRSGCQSMMGWAGSSVMNEVKENWEVFPLALGHVHLIGCDACHFLTAGVFLK